MIDKLLLKMGYVKLPKPQDDEVVVHPFVRKKRYPPVDMGVFEEPFGIEIYSEPPTDDEVVINPKNFIEELDLPEFPGTKTEQMDDPLYNEASQLTLTDPRD